GLGRDSLAARTGGANSASRPLTVSVVILFLLLRFVVRSREALLAGPAPRYGRRTFQAASSITRGAGTLFHRQEHATRRPARRVPVWARRKLSCMESTPPGARCSAPS